MKQKKRLIVFLKEGIPGQVKTRLSRSIGADLAAEAYCSMLKDLERNLSACKDMVFPMVDRGSNRCFYPPKGIQEGKDLGERMYSAFQLAFSQEIDMALLIGSDIPDITEPLISEYFSALLFHDVVLGPTPDGGYYLVGFKSTTLVRDIFFNIPWSTENVFERTQSLLTELNYNSYIGTKKHDIDSLDDLKSLVNNPETRELIPYLTEFYEKKIIMC